MKIIRRFALSACCAALVAVATQSAHAQSNACVDLEAQLVALEHSGGAASRQQYRELDNLARRQQSEINQASAEARRARCTGGLFQRPEAKCDLLMSTIQRMKSNLRRLSAERSKYSRNPADVSRQRNRILRALNTNRCRSNGTASGNRQRGLFETLFGTPRTRTWGEDVYSRSTAGRGTYRTLCVRTCDGYYFPISFSTVPQRFSQDQQTCQALCPGSQVALYTHRNPGQESGAMVSLAGEPYTSLPTAFKYRSEYDGSCSCGSPAAHRGQLPLTPANLAASAFNLVVPFPRPRPVRGEDPETVANRYGGLKIQRVAIKADIATSNLPAAPEVRVVGPSFYYGQQTEIRVLVPVTKPRLESELDRPSGDTEL